MKTALEEVLALPMLALVVEQAIEVLDPGVVKFTYFLDQQQIDAGHALRLGTESVTRRTPIPAKYVDGKGYSASLLWGSEKLVWVHQSLRSSDYHW